MTIGSDKQTLSIIRSADGPDLTSNDEMAQGLDAIANKFKEIANDLRSGKLFSCPSRGGAAFAGTHKDGSYHVDIELCFIPVVQPTKTGSH